MEEWLRSLGFGDRASNYAANLSAHGIDDLPDLLRFRPVVGQLIAWGIQQPEHAQRIADAIAEAVLSDEADSPRPYPESLEPERLPIFLAHAWQEYWQARSHRLKLYLLLDFAELCVRFATAVAIGEAAAHGRGQLAGHVIENLLEAKLTLPTLGNWCGLLRATVGGTWHRSHQSRPAIAALHDALEGDGPLQGWFDKNDDSEEALGRSLLALRNRVYHSGATAQAARYYCDQHNERLEILLSTLMKALDGRRIVASVRDEEDRLKWYDLTGLTPDELSPEQIPIGTTASGVFLLKAPLPPLGLWPLAVFEKIGAGGSSAEGETRAQLYSRAHQRSRHVEGVDYTPIGGDEIFSRLSHHAKRFSEFFQLGAYRTKRDGHAPTDLFVEAVKGAKSEFKTVVGRDREIGAVTAWYKDAVLRPGVDAKRIAWISGPPGIGKSALMAEVAEIFLTERASEKRWGFYYRFQEGQTGNSLLQFLVALRESLRGWAALREKAPPLLPAVTGGAVENEATVLARVIEQLATISGLAADVASDAHGLVVFVDGADECADRVLLPERIRQLALPGTAWIVAGRADFGLNEAFASVGAEFLFGPEGLPGLTWQGVREMFFNENDHLRGAIRKLDINFPGEVTVSNRFIRRVWEMSQDHPGSERGGNPQYVHLILDDLAQRRYTVQEVVDNPRLLSPGLAAAYDRILQRLGMTDSSTLLPLIAAWLAMAYEPLPAELLVRLLAKTRPLLDDLETGVREAVGWGRSLLLPLHTPEKMEGWAIQHQSFRDHMRATGWIRRTRQECAEALLRLIEEWRGQPAADETVTTSGQAYLLRHSLRHLLEMRLPAARPLLAALAADAGYLEQMLTAHQSAAGSDLSGFFDDLYDVHAALEGGTADERAVSGNLGGQTLEALLRTRLRTNESLDTEDIHALLIYRKPTHDSQPGFYSQMLARAREPVFWEPLEAEFPPERLDRLRGGFLAKAGNYLRRLGPTRFAKAEALLERGVSLLEPLINAGDGVALRELSRIEYDLGYVLALRGNLEPALESFARSAATADRAGNVAGAWVSRCVGAVFRFQSDQDADRLLATLDEALKIFREQADVHGNGLAKQWIANVWVHSFNASWHKGDLPNAKLYHERALDDPWLRAKDWLVRATRLRNEPRLLALEGRYAEAFALFDAQLAVPDLRDTESAAEHFWDYGTLLERTGRAGDARRLWKQALEELPPENGNTYWFDRMRLRLAASATP